MLEARDRVGGRVWSQQLPNGAIVERGAEFVERDQSTLIAAVERLGLRLAPTGMSYSDREPRGGRGVTHEQLLATLAGLKRELAARPEDAALLSAAAYLNRQEIDAGAREVIAARLQVTCAHPVEEIAASHIDHISFEHVEGLRIAGGNQGVALRLAETLEPHVHLSCPVQAVSWTPGGVCVRAAETTIEADACVIAVPATVLDAMRFDPPLPGWKTGALRGVSYAHAAKLFAPLKRTAPPSAVLSVPEHFWTWTAQGADGIVQPVVSAFAGSCPALERLRVEEGAAYWLKRLCALRPDLEIDPDGADGALLSTWADDPWARGVYSVLTPTTPPGNGDALARPIACLHFAGEHTAGPWSGFMEGALRSGIRAAEEILAATPAREGMQR